ncbi:MAG TPA: hypothetical protein VHS31_06925 [Tepidisphaeraceae bacterium]|jgi:hypothetical protein|nr:hypothetical protein [Tepidisphaeraceae bacterium]
MTQMPYLPPDVRLVDDRRTVLLVMGIILIVLGIFCGCMTAITPLALLAPRAPGVSAPRLRDLLSGWMIYALATVGFIWTGIGSIQRRRWVRPVVLVFSWLWLVMGIFALIAFSSMFGDFQNAFPTPSTTTPTPPPALPALFFAAMIAFVAILYIVVPIIFILCYKSPAVQATLEFYDPNPRWTDARPIPALIFCAILAIGALWSLFGLAPGIFLFFGLLLTGPIARLALLAAAFLFVLSTWWSYHLRPSGWKLGLTLTLLLSTSAIITLLHVPLMEIYRAAGTPPDQMETISRMHMLKSGLIATYAALGLILTVTYALYVRRYFLPSPNPQTIPSP